ncbi:MAG: hypothetical protein KA207_02845 [Burkholderiaceae bacterium]|nr:hypothetical protein [Burkholderiaceae bacterium]
MKHPASWLIITTAPDRYGRETALLARASYNLADDLLTVIRPDGKSTATQGGGHPLKPLAELLVRELFRKEGAQG